MSEGRDIKDIDRRTRNLEIKYFLMGLVLGISASYCYIAMILRFNL